MAVCYVLYSSINSFQCFRCQNDWKWEQHSIPKDGLKTGILSFSSLLLVTFDLSSSTFEELKMARGALEAAAVARRNLQHARVHQAVLICTALLATHMPWWRAIQRQRAETAWPLVQYSLATGYISRLRHRGNPASAEPRGRQQAPHWSREFICALAAGWAHKRETFFLSAVTKPKKPPSAVILQLTALSHMQAVWKSYQQKWIVWIRRLCASLRVCF